MEIWCCKSRPLWTFCDGAGKRQSLAKSPLCLQLTNLQDCWRVFKGYSSRGPHQIPDLGRGHLALNI